MLTSFTKITAYVRSFLGKPGRTASARQAIDRIIGSADENKDLSLEPEEKILMKNILRLRDLTAEDVMTPRVDMKAVDAKISFKDLVETVSQTEFSRLPVFSESLDDIIGCLHVKDVSRVSKEKFKCRDLLSQVLFIPTSMRLLELLIQMKATRVTMAFVVDEFGGVDGLVTSWDIIREMMGDIDDFEAGDSNYVISRLSDNSLIVDGRFRLEALQEPIYGVLSNEEIDTHDTVAGLVMHMAGRVPSVHEVLDHTSGTQFEVTDTDGRRVKRVRVYPYKR